MNASRDPETILAAWLDEGPTDLPDATRRAILTALPTTSQARRGQLAPGRLFQMNATARLVAGAFVALIAVGGALYLFGSNGQFGSGGPGPTPSCASAAAPSIAASPGSTPLDRGTWTTYLSNRFGFSICYPADWISDPAIAGLDPNKESFVAADQSIYLSAWSVAVDPGKTLEAFVQATCVGYHVTCDGWQAQATTVIVDGHAGTVAVLGPCSDSTCSSSFVEAFLLVDNRMYRITSGRAPGEYDSDRLVGTFFSTMHLLPGGPAPSGSNPAPS